MADFPYVARTQAYYDSTATPSTVKVTPSTPLPVTDTAGNAKLDTINTSVGALAISGSGRDAFFRLRVSDPQTLFDSKQLFDNAPLLFDDQAVSGSGTSSTHSTARASSTIGVSATTAGKRVRQSFQRMNYQPGKSQLALLTGILIKSGGGAGITSGIGLFTDNNGVFWKYDAGTLKVVVRSSVTGSPVDTEVSQASFNGDPLDGTGASGVTIDPTKVQIFWMDYEWLGTGRVRFGIVNGDEMIVAHTAYHANISSAVYMSTPNLPIRYQIENTGAGAASTLEQICSTVISEGGQDPIGARFGKSTEGTALSASTSGTVYAVLGLRLKSTHIGASVLLANIDMVARNAVDFIWSLRWNPTVAGTFTYADVDTNCACQTAAGATANTITGGHVMATGYVKASNTTGTINLAINNALKLGSSITGTRDQLVLCARPLANNASIEGAMNWRELT